MGGQKGIASFYQYFSRHCEVTLLSTADNETPKDLDAEFLPILSTSKWRYANLFFIFRLGKIVKQRKATHLILEHPYMGWLGILAKWFYGVKLVIHSHNIESLRFKSTGKWWWRILARYEKWVHKRAHINFFITDEDKAYAIERFHLKPSSCHTITYGFERANAPEPTERAEAKLKLQQIHNIPSNHLIMLFNGTLNYPPNLQALLMILNDINPMLRKKSQQPYSIIICGKDLPEEMQELKAYEKDGIIFAGFVPDISLYFLGADVFLNPVSEGGGIKTKLVEALGFNLHCISTTSGAIGIPVHITNHQLTLVDDHDAEGFTNQLINITTSRNPIGKEFFDYFYWNNIAAKACQIINSQP